MWRHTTTNAICRSENISSFLPHYAVSHVTFIALLESVTVAITVLEFNGQSTLLCPRPLLLSARLCLSVRRVHKERKGPACPNLEGSFPTLDATRIPVSRSNGQRSGLKAVGGIPCQTNPTATLHVSIGLYCELAFTYCICSFLKVKN